MSQTDPFIKFEGLLDNYDQIEQVAVGGMAEIYRARQKNLDRPVAIKRIKPEIRSHKQIQERFRREARFSANMLHQNLAHVYDYREADPEFFLVMEYIDGFDLSEVIEKSGNIPFDVAAMIAVSVLRGLDHVHSHAMVHRDIKPDNIRISLRGEVKIMDFGIAFDPGEEQLTKPGLLIGSPHYLAPEQIVGERPNAASDIFSFGVTFYEMLTGERPFVEKEGMSVYQRIQKGVYTDIGQLRTDIPSFAMKIIRKCLQVDHQSRPKSAIRIANALEEYLSKYHTLNFNLRIKQFLMEKKLIQGNPNLIEIHDTSISNISVKKNNLSELQNDYQNISDEDKYYSKNKSQMISNILKVSLILLALVLCYFVVQKIKT